MTGFSDVNTAIIRQSEGQSNGSDVFLKGTPPDITTLKDNSDSHVGSQNLVPHGSYDQKQQYQQDGFNNDPNNYH